MHGSGAGVDVGALALDFRLHRAVLRCLCVGFGRSSNLIVDSCGTWPRGRRVAFCGVSVFGHFSYKLANSFIMY
jgi:hypothetical protein